MINNHIIERDKIYSNALILKVFEDKELKLTFVTHQYDMSYRLTILNYTPPHQECLIYLFKNKLVKSHIPKSTRVKYIDHATNIEAINYLLENGLITIDLPESQIIKENVNYSKVCNVKLTTKALLESL